MSDFLAFRNSHKAGELSWGKYLKSLLHRQHFQYFRWNDPMPVLRNLGPFLRHEWGKLTGRKGDSKRYVGRLAHLSATISGQLKDNGKY